MILAISRTIFATPWLIQARRRDIKNPPAVVALSCNSSYLTTIRECISRFTLLYSVMPSLLVAMKARWYKVFRSVIMRILVKVVSIECIIPLTGAITFGPMDYCPAKMTRVRAWANLFIKNNSVLKNRTINRGEGVIRRTYHFVSTITILHSSIVAHFLKVVKKNIKQGV